MGEAAVELEDVEMAYAILEPHYDAVRDFFADTVPEGASEPLSKVRQTKLLVDPVVRNSERHYAACRDDGLLIVLAPQAAQLPMDTLVAVITHECGHATDFLSPGRFLGRKQGPAAWVPSDAKKQGRIRRMWSERTDDQIEWDADSIAWAVTGKQIRYCGSCMLQCFSGGRPRPEGLR